MHPRRDSRDHDSECKGDVRSTVRFRNLVVTTDGTRHDHYGVDGHVVPLWSVAVKLGSVMRLFLCPSFQRAALGNAHRACRVRASWGRRLELQGGDVDALGVGRSVEAQRSCAVSVGRDGGGRSCAHPTPSRSAAREPAEGPYPRSPCAGPRVGRAARRPGRCSDRPCGMSVATRAQFGNRHLRERGGQRRL